MEKEHNISIKSLLSIQEKLKRELRWLLCEYDDYRSYLRNSRHRYEAEEKYYTKMYYESGYESEGLFSLHHKSLKTMIKENRKERIKISQDLKNIKNQIKEKHRYENKYRNISKK